MKHPYLNDYAELYSKISHIMFLYDYHLACEISTVRILALMSRRPVYVYFVHLTQIGDRVIAADNFGLWTEGAAVAAERTFLMPDNMTFEEGVILFSISSQSQQIDIQNSSFINS